MRSQRPNTGSRRPLAANEPDISTVLSLLLNTTKGRDKLLLELLAQTGITPAELVELKKKDLKAHDNTLRLRAETTKNKLRRTIRLPQNLARRLLAHAHTHTKEHVFCTRQSTKLTTRRIEQVLKDASKQAGLRQSITARDLRNNYLQAAKKHAKDDEELRKITGLKTISARTGLDEEQQEAVIKAAKESSPREEALIQALIHTQLSLAQTLALEKRHLNKDFLRVAGTNIPLPKGLSKQLQQLTLATDTATIFNGRQGPLTQRRAEQLIKEIGKKAGLELTSHELRRTTSATYATRGGEAQ